MKRRLFAILSALSLLLCVAAVVLWVRSYSHCDTATLVLNRRPSPDRFAYWSFHLPSNRGMITVDCQTGTHPASRYERRVRLDFRSSPADPRPFDAGFDAARHVRWRFGNVLFVTDRGRDWTVYIVTVPTWALVVLFGALPLAYVASSIRHRRLRRSGLCRRCGYDLILLPRPVKGTLPEPTHRP